MEKINLVEILKNCPSGMELDCTMYNGVEFMEVDTESDTIILRVGNKFIRRLNKYGQEDNVDYAKCIIFPKGKTTWNGFVPPYPFKDGDFVATNSGLQVFILQRAKSNTSGYCYIGYDFEFNEFFDAGEWNFDRLATEEEKRKLFQAIKTNGYKWDSEAKTLGNLIEPIFKINDNIQSKEIKSPVRIVDIKDGKYIFENGDKLDINSQNRWEFVSNKFDINRLIPFESKVLVRDYPNEKWKPAIWGFYDNDDKNYSSYIIESGIDYNYCIPYKGNEHLIGTINDCESYYKTWENEN